jgi:alpha-methylacyl-CoA racemase
MPVKPLESCKVLESAFYLPAPLAGLILSDLGADVIKVESPPDGDPLRLLGGSFSTEGGKAFHSFNRGKRSCVLNLKEGPGREAFMLMARRADVLLVSMRPSTMEKLGIDYRSVRKINPRIVYCSITGYGLKGPWAERAGHDMNYQASAGILHLGRDGDGNVVFTPFPAADIFGSFHAALGILAALIEREKTGEGKLLDISMTESVLSANLFNMSLTDVPGESYEARGKMLTGKYAFYNAYATKDGRWLALAAIEAKFWKRFCEVIGKEDLVGRQFDINATAEVRAVLVGKDFDEWMRLFKDEDVCLEPVIDLEGALSHPQALFRGSIAENTETLMAFNFIPYSPDPARNRAPLLGEHTARVLEVFGVPDSLIAVVAGP